MEWEEWKRINNRERNEKNNRRKERNVNREETDGSEWMNKERGLEEKIYKRRS